MEVAGWGARRKVRVAAVGFLDGRRGKQIAKRAGNVGGQVWRLWIVGCGLWVVRCGGWNKNCFPRINQIKISLRISLQSCILNTLTIDPTKHRKIRRLKFVGERQDYQVPQCLRIIYIHTKEEDVQPLTFTMAE